VAKKFTEVLKQIDKEINEFWERDKTREKANSKRQKQFVFVDGPPYANAMPHAGHLRNIIAKDAYLRFKLLKGYKIIGRAGYDTHGLPIEVKVQEKLGLKTKEDILKFGVENFIKECEKYVKEQSNQWTEIRKNLGQWIDLDAYYTCDKEYISFAWYFFKKAEEKGLLKKMNRTVAWCPHCETPLSDYEIKEKYTLLKDPSIYVKFKVRGSKNEYLVIWTTTPWTLLANMLIAVNPKYEYCKVKVNYNGKEEIWYLAKVQVEKLMEKFGIENYEILETISGRELEGIRYEHIFEESEQKHGKYLKVVCADFVTLGETLDEARLSSKKGKHHADISGHKTRAEYGTGLVHCAPGHGTEDFMLGLKEGVPIYSPVNEKGILTEGPFAGEYFRDANPKIIEYLKEKGVLIYHEEIEHKYPLCWRCETPILWRASPQWWIERSKYKERMIELVENNIEWHPSFAKLNMLHVLKTMPDWCISRERFWGIPIPIWECEKCGKYKVFGSVEELEKVSGIKIDDPHLPQISKIELTCECGRKMKHCGFICDVWFDSGCASYASHYKDNCKTIEDCERYYPIDFIIEGIDQFRGWFASLLSVGVLIFDKEPYKKITYNGFVLDHKGEKMSKSKGNVVWAKDAYENWGATLTRYYILSKNEIYEEMNLALEQEKKEYIKLFNIILNILNLIKNPSEQFEVKTYADKWIINKLYKVAKECEEHMEKLEFVTYSRKWSDFVINDFSRTYIKIAKENLDSNTQAIIKYVLTKSLVGLAPIIPHFCEYIYKKLYGRSLFVEEEYPSSEYDEEIILNFEKMIEISEEILSLRNEHGIPLRQPIRKIFINVDLPDELKELLKSMCNCKEVVVGEKVKIDTNLDQELLEEGFIRTLSRHIQQERKKLKLTPEQKIKIVFDCDEKLKEIIMKNKDYLSNRTNADIEFGAGEKKMKIKCMLGEFEIGFKIELL
jgi:isoleucyl-tRNA synthetase